MISAIQNSLLLRRQFFHNGLMHSTFQILVFLFFGIHCTPCKYIALRLGLFFSLYHLLFIISSKTFQQLQNSHPLFLNV